MAVALADLTTIKRGWNLLPCPSLLFLPPLMALRASPAPWPVTQAAEGRMESRERGSGRGMERKKALSCCWQGGVVTTSAPCTALGAEKCANNFVNIGMKQIVGVTEKSLLFLTAAHCCERTLTFKLQATFQVQDDKPPQMHLYFAFKRGGCSATERLQHICFLTTFSEGRQVPFSYSICS